MMSLRNESKSSSLLCTSIGKAILLRAALLFCSFWTAWPTSVFHSSACSFCSSVMSSLSSLRIARSV